MLLKDLVDQVSWKDVKQRMLELYPDEDSNLPGYAKVFWTLKQTAPIKNKAKNNLQLYIVWDEVLQCYEVWGKEKENPVSQGLETFDWDEWLGCEISEETLNSFTKVDIVVCCLYEMTLDGFSTTHIRAEREELLKHALLEDGPGEVSAVIREDHLSSLFGELLVRELKKRGWIVVQAKIYDLMCAELDRLSLAVEELEERISDLEETKNLVD